MRSSSRANKIAAAKHKEDAGNFIKACFEIIWHVNKSADKLLWVGYKFRGNCRAVCRTHQFKDVSVKLIHPVTNSRPRI